MSLLKVTDLKVHFPIHGGILYREIATVHAVDGVSLEVEEGEVLGVVGESGCGKSTTAKAIMQLYKASSGKVVFMGEEIQDLSEKELEPFRKEIQMIFQDPYESLNPRHSVEQIIEEPLIIHTKMTKKERISEVEKLLELVGLSKEYRHRYPHEFSGGQRQRIGIARAIALKPKLIICDEPVSALDVSIQSQILNLLLELQDKLNLSYIFVAHDLAVVKHISDRVAVMYLGVIVELADSETIYKNPAHPYTKALLEAIPHPDPKKRSELKPLSGDVPSPLNPPLGCRFQDRCPMVQSICRETVPQLKPVAGNQRHVSACHFAEEVSS